MDTGIQVSPINNVNGLAKTNGHHDHEHGYPAGTGGLDSKSNSITQIVGDAISYEARQTISSILDQVERLSTPERLLLYLKLPTGQGETPDPLRQPLNPLGSRFEIHQTITWIRTHLEEDSEVSLPKQDVYDEYLAFCSNNNMKPLSTADFGKVMKQVFPRVRPRRLGTRGNSRYCYAGMRKRVKLEPPELPDLVLPLQIADGEINNGNSTNNQSVELSAAATCLVREWAEKLLGVPFLSMRHLANHLVDNHCVDTRSVAALTLLSQRPCSDSPSISTSTPGVTVVHSTNSTVSTTSANPSPCTTSSSLQNTPPVNVKSFSNSPSDSKHREAQIQLQRKLHEREVIREQKRKLQDQTAAIASKVSPAAPVSNPTIVEKSRAKRSRSHLGTGSAPVKRSPGISSTNKAQESGVVTTSTNGCDNVMTSTPSISGGSQCDSGEPTATVTSPEAVNQTAKLKEIESNRGVTASATPLPPPAAKLPIPRLPKLSSVGNSVRIILPPSSIASLPQERKKYKPIQPKPNTEIPPLTHNTAASISSTSEDATTAARMQAEAVSIGCLEKDALDDYLHGGDTSSHDQEEELMRYFQSPEVASVFSKGPAQDEKLSQLRQLLERNLKSNSLEDEVFMMSSAPVPPPRARPATSVGTSTRRRVSFETSCTQIELPSPTTRRKNFAFTPISPGPSSANASPFVSPRNTPLPRSRQSSSVTRAPLPPPFPVPQIGQNINVSNLKGNLSCGMTSASAPQSPLDPVDHLTMPSLVCSQPNTPRDPLSKEVSQFFTDASLLALSGPYRSQSVPLHPRTLSSTGKPPLQNPLTISTQLNMNLQKGPYPPTPCYTAPTPVPSELMDFADVTSNPSAALLGDTTTGAEDNLNNYLIMFDDQTSTDDLSFQRSYTNTPVPTSLHMGESEIPTSSDPEGNIDPSASSLGVEVLPPLLDESTFEDLALDPLDTVSFTEFVNEVVGNAEVT